MKLHLRELVVLGVVFILLGFLGYSLVNQQNNHTDLLSSTNPEEKIAEENNNLNQIELNDNKNMSNEEYSTAIIKTNYGTIILDLYQDVMPITVGNFVDLAQEGFYDGTKFHRVISGFMIQGGDPNTKSDDVASYGTGGPGYTIEDEFVDDERLSNVVGTVAMANTGQPNSGGSQFFINVADNTNLDFDKQPLTSKHPVFARVQDGMDVVRAIEKLPTNERDLPLEPVVIESIIVR